MKKVLFATTALVGSAGLAGMASAEVTVAGFAEMGIFGGEQGGDDIDTQFHNDFTTIFTFSGQTDNGLTFGATIELEDEDSDGDGGTRGGPGGPIGIFNTTSGDDEINGGINSDNEAVFVSGNFGTITLGETDGALDFAMTETAVAGGTIRDDHTLHPGYNGNSGTDGTFDNQIARYEYNFGNFAVAVSAELNDNDDDQVDDQGNTIDERENAYGIGLTYSTMYGSTELGFGLGYQTIDELDEDLLDDDDDGGGRDRIGLSMDANFDNGLILALNYMDMDDLGEHYGIGVGYSQGPIAASINYGEYNFDDFEDAEGVGIAASYDLGGGAEVQFGYGGGDQSGVEDDYNSYSLGLALSF